MMALTVKACGCHIDSELAESDQHGPYCKLHTVRCLSCDREPLECECAEPCCEGCGCSVGVGGIEGLCADCCEVDEEPEAIDDGVRFCPDCERPNQFGELCETCVYERGEEARRS